MGEIRRKHGEQSTAAPLLSRKLLGKHVCLVAVYIYATTLSIIIFDIFVINKIFIGMAK